MVQLFHGKIFTYLNTHTYICIYIHTIIHDISLYINIYRVYIYIKYINYTVFLEKISEIIQLECINIIEAFNYILDLVKSKILINPNLKRN